MTSNEWEMLESRVTRLEKQNRWIGAACILAGLAVVSVLTLGAYKPANTVEAQRFVLKSAKGEVRAELATPDGDYPILKLVSPNGQKVTELSPLGVSVFDSALPGQLPVGHFGNTGLYFTDQKGRMVVEVGGASVSASVPQIAPIPEITIFDEKGQPAWRAP